jgi:phosphatidylcholine synthase
MALLAAMEICAADPQPRRVFLWLALAVLIDATDGPLARRLEVKRFAPWINGRLIDDIVDYLTFTFLPLLLVWRMEWVPAWASPVVAAAMVASLLGFAHSGAKQEAEGFFRGFPSYWNVYAFYAGLWQGGWAPAAWAATLAVLAALTVLPVRFVYPNLAPRPWRGAVLGGAAAWLAILLAMLWDYPHPPSWLSWLSLVYPVFYLGLSAWLDAKNRRAARLRR